MTVLKIVGSPTAAAMAALEPHVMRLYDKPGARVMAVVELAHVERVQPAPGSDGKPVVKMKITGCEVPNREQEGAIREAQRALFLARTARGTLDEEGMLNLNEDTLKNTSGLLMSIECARLRAGLLHWTEYARRVVGTSGTLSQTEMAHELQSIADGMASTLDQAAPEEDE
jgi:hypothetical protein